jgi:hypothetical protein
MELTHLSPASLPEYSSAAYIELFGSPGDLPKLQALVLIPDLETYSQIEGHIATHFPNRVALLHIPQHFPCRVLFLLDNRHNHRALTNIVFSNHTNPRGQPSPVKGLVIYMATKGSEPNYKHAADLQDAAKIYSAWLDDTADLQLTKDSGSVFNSTGLHVSSIHTDGSIHTM